MRSRKNTVITFISSLVILASCASSNGNHSNENVALNEAPQDIAVNKYFRYNNFSQGAIKKLDLYIKDSQLSRNELNGLKKLRSNMRKIALKEKFILNIEKSNVHSFELIQLIYSLNLPIKIAWGQSSENYTSNNLLSTAPMSFCASMYDDALKAIANEINGTSAPTLLIYSETFTKEQKFLASQFPTIKSILFDKSDPQQFAAEVLGINSSNKRFKRIASLNPNQKLKFANRPRNDIQKIFLLLRPDQFQSVLPAFRYHGGNKFQYINFISSLETLNTTNQLLDFENSLVPLSERLSQDIRSKEIRSLENIMHESMLHDWLLIEILKQAGIRSANINGMTGALEYERNTCTKRSLPIQRINSNWITS